MLKDNLIRLRSLHGYTQEEIAERIDISRQAYAKWENGQTVPDIEKCSRLADIYGVTVDGLLHTQPVGEVPVVPPPKGKNIWGSVTINDRGQVIIPKALREKFSLSAGARLIVLSDDNEGMALVPAEIFEERMKQMLEIAAVQLER